MHYLFRVAGLCGLFLWRETEMAKRVMKLIDPAADLAIEYFTMNLFLLKGGVTDGRVM